MLKFYMDQKSLYERKSNGHPHYGYAIRLFDELISKEKKGR